MKQGDIVSVPFPFSDLSSSKVRPALVVSQSSHGDDLILVFISHKKHPGAVRLFPRDFIAGGLLKVSFVRYHKLATLSRHIVRKRIAVLSSAKIKEIVLKIRSLF